MAGLELSLALSLPLSLGGGCAAITSASQYHTAPAEAEAGAPVDRTPLRIGMPTALQGPSADLGIEMKRGVEAWFKRANENGTGRPFELDAVNDDYEPVGATVAIKQLLDVQGALLPNDCGTSFTPPDCVTDRPDTLGSNRVLSILGQVGTPTMEVTAPVCIRNRVVYFGAFTGAERFLRDSQTISNVVFNYRASYYEEAAAFVDYLFHTHSPPVNDYTRIIAFTQNDSFGDDGYDGLSIAYGIKVAPVAENAIKRVVYTRNENDVTQAATDTQAYLQPILNQVLGSSSAPTPVSVGFFMVPSYEPAARYIKSVRDWINADKDRARVLLPVFASVSFVGADALAAQLKALGTYVDVSSGATKFYGDGVWIAEVVPSYDANLPGVVQYRQDQAAFDGQPPTWGALEGYLAARLFTEGLGRTKTFDPDAMVAAYESIKDFDLGIGPKVSFDNALPEGHQASHTVWLSQLSFDADHPNGTFAVPWLWQGAAGTSAITRDDQIAPP